MARVSGEEWIVGDGGGAQGMVEVVVGFVFPFDMWLPQICYINP